MTLTIADSASDQLIGLENLRNTFAWPSVCPNAKRVQWCLDAGGKQLVEELICSKPNPIVLEIGSFVGGSVSKWLDCSPEATVICVDPWSFAGSLREFAQRHGQTEEIIQQLDRPDGVYETFLANLWEDRDRVIPIRGSSPQALHQIANHRVEPDVIFIDSDKSGCEIEICSELFPKATITGDDWWFGKDKWIDPNSGYPIRRSVLDFCKKHDRYLRTHQSTWVIDSEPPSIGYLLQRPSYHFKSVRRRVRGLFRTAIRRAG